jgi:hypothetical protein
MLYWSGCRDSKLCSGDFSPECKRGAKPRRGVRVAEGARLESVFGGNLNVGSNPTLSAIVLSLNIKYFNSTIFRIVQSLSLTSKCHCAIFPFTRVKI